MILETQKKYFPS